MILAIYVPKRLLKYLRIWKKNIELRLNQQNNSIWLSYRFILNGFMISAITSFVLLWQVFFNLVWFDLWRDTGSKGSFYNKLPSETIFSIIILEKLDDILGEFIISIFTIPLKTFTAKFSNETKCLSTWHEDIWKYQKRYEGSFKNLIIQTTLLLNRRVLEVS